MAKKTWTLNTPYKGPYTIHRAIILSTAHATDTIVSKVISKRLPNNPPLQLQYILRTVKPHNYKYRRGTAVKAAVFQKVAAELVLTYLQTNLFGLAVANGQLYCMGLSGERRGGAGLTIWGFGCTCRRHKHRDIGKQERE